MYIKKAHKALDIGNILELMILLMHYFQNSSSMCSKKKQKAFYNRSQRIKKGYTIYSTLGNYDRPMHIF